MPREKIAVFGDIHGNLEAFQAVLEVMRQQEVTHYVCIGDIVGYNSNPKECLDILRSLNPIAVIRGNHDEYIGTEQELTGFNPQAAAAVEWTRKQLPDEDRKWLAQLKYQMPVRRPGTGMKPFRIVHGTLDNPDKWGYIFSRFSAAASMEFQRPEDLCFCGHTHIPQYFVRDGWGAAAYDYEDGPVELKPNTKYLFNVGSVGQPRDGDPRAAFAIYVPQDATIQLFRVEYDIETCQEKILDAGLPERLAQRLLAGR